MKKNEKTYTVSRETIHFLVKTRRYMHSAWLNEEYPCYRDKEFTQRMADFFDENLSNMFYGVLLSSMDVHKQKYTDFIDNYALWL